MARLRKLGRAYYARIRMTKKGGQKERCINLGTREKSTAARRLVEVQRMEEVIKAGEELDWSWETKQDHPTIKRMTIGEAVNAYVAARNVDLDSPLRLSSVAIIEQSFKRFESTINYNRHLDTLSQDDIDGFKRQLHDRGLSTATINISTRNLRTWVSWLKRKELYSGDLTLKQIPVRNQKPIYVTNAEFDSILSSVDDYLRRVFNLYRETGMRLKEPLLGEIKGNWLIVKPEDSKSGREREVYLTEKQILTVQEMQRKTHLESGSSAPQRSTNSFQYFSRTFKEACVANGIEGKHLHCLRHTFALREYLKTRDLYGVAKKCGHSSLSVTQVYADFNLRRLAEDFPDIVTEGNGI